MKDSIPTNYAYDAEQNCGMAFLFKPVSNKLSNLTESVSSPITTTYFIYHTLTLPCCPCP